MPASTLIGADVGARAGHRSLDGVTDHVGHLGDDLLARRASGRRVPRHVDGGRLRLGGGARTEDREEGTPKDLRGPPLGVPSLGPHRQWTAAPSKRPTAAVTAMAQLPPKVTRNAAGTIGAPPRDAPSAPKRARLT